MSWRGPLCCLNDFSRYCACMFLNDFVFNWFITQLTWLVHIHCSAHSTWVLTAVSLQHFALLGGIQSSLCQSSSWLLLNCLTARFVSQKHMACRGLLLLTQHMVTRLVGLMSPSSPAGCYLSPAACVEFTSQHYFTSRPSNFVLLAARRRKHVCKIG